MGPYFLNHRVPCPLLISTLPSPSRPSKYLLTVQPNRHGRTSITGQDGCAMLRCRLAGMLGYAWCAAWRGWPYGWRVRHWLAVGCVPKQQATKSPANWPGLVGCGYLLGLRLKPSVFNAVAYKGSATRAGCGCQCGSGCLALAGL